VRGYERRIYRISLPDGDGDIFLEKAMTVSRTFYRFDEVSTRREKSVKCLGCGKRLRRAKRFYQTINPFNTNADGAIKSRAEIMSELQAEAAAWMNKPEKCSTCEETP
jgi:hypothetical protein